MKQNRCPRIHLTLAVITLACAFLLPMTVKAGGGGPLVVNTVDDFGDPYCDSHCSLRDAIHQANQIPGVQEIHFDIYGAGPHVIELCAPLPTIVEGVIIDGTTEPDYTIGSLHVVVKPEETPSLYDQCDPPAYGLWIESDDVVVRGLSLIGFSGPGSFSAGVVVNSGTGNLIERNFFGTDPQYWPPNNWNGVLLNSPGQHIRANRFAGNSIGIHVLWGNQTIQSNLIGTDPSGMFSDNELHNARGILVEDNAPNNLIGGTNLTQANLISGNDIGVDLLSQGNQIIGNYFGTNASGDSIIGNGIGLQALGSGTANTIGGMQSGMGNLISGNGFGLWLGTGNTVVGNLIGTDKYGITALPNINGITIDGDANVIGGAGSGLGNLISGNSSMGIFLNPWAENNLILGNKFGTDPSGSSPLGNGDGIGISGVSNQIGDLGSGEGNLFAFNVNGGIKIVGTASDNQIIGNTITGNQVGIFGESDHSERNTILYNSMYENSQLGIDLAPVGVTSNDPNDTDTGANTLLNYPEFDQVNHAEASGTACPGCVVEVHISDDDPSDHGEGRTRIGGTVTQANGVFNLDLNLPSYACEFITATATDPDGNTSEFSPNHKIGNCYVLETPIAVIFIIVMIVVGVAVGFAFGRTTRYPTAAAAPLGGAAGMVIGTGLLALAAALPNIQIVPPQRALEVEPAALVPSCDTFLDPTAFHPEDGFMFEPGEEVDLGWKLRRSQHEADLRWQVEFMGPDMWRWSATTFETKLSVLPQEQGARDEGVFFWRLAGEQFTPDGEEWTHYCSPSRWHTFQFGFMQPLIAAPPTTEPSSPEETRTTETPTPTPTGTPTPSTCTYQAIENANCRASDYAGASLITILLQGETATLIAVNPELTHGQFELPSQQQCWIWLGLMDGPEKPVNECGVPVIDPPPPTETPTPITCSPDFEQQACEASGGAWTGSAAGAPQCVCP